jgi:hypothetical protein
MAPKPANAPKPVEEALPSIPATLQCITDLQSELSKVQYKVKSLLSRKESLEFDKKDAKGKLEAIRLVRQGQLSRADAGFGPNDDLSVAEADAKSDIAEDEAELKQVEPDLKAARDEEDLLLRRLSELGAEPPPRVSMFCPMPGVVEVAVSLGASNTSTDLVNTGNFSAGIEDPHSPNSANGSGSGFVGGVGLSLALGEFASPFAAGGSSLLGYASEAERAYAYAPVSPAARRRGVTFGIVGNVYFFAGGAGQVTGIPGGPFGTANGADTFKISNNYMFTVGGWVSVPLFRASNVALTGGFAELSQTIKYDCVTFCAVAPATSAFTASQDKWIPGSYIGARVSMPVLLPIVGEGTFGIDYKHLFFREYDVALGNVATRQVNARLSPDLDLVTVRLTVPLR